MLFFYQQERTFETKNEKGEVTSTETVTVEDCFNLNKVTRAYWDTTEKFVVILDDGHEQAENKPVPIFDGKGKIKGAKMERVREWYCSMITLNPQEAKLFKQLTDVNSYVSDEEDLEIDLGKIDLPSVLDSEDVEASNEG